MGRGFMVLVTLAVLVMFSSIGFVAAGSVAACAAESEDVTMPKIIPGSCVLPEYPEDARKAGIEGTVLVDVLVNKHGQVAAVKVKEGIEECPSMDRSAVSAVRQWTFEPATKDGKAIEIEVTVPIKFVLDDKKCKKEK